jgi:hypothetical protein
MAIKRLLLILTAFCVLSSVCVSVRLAYAQATTSTTSEAPSWQLLIEYLVVGSFFGALHDINDNAGLIILPTKKANGQWDLGILSPALLGAAAGFISQYVANVPILAGLFPSLGVAAPGLLAAAIAGYFYAKLFAVISSLMPAATTQAQALKTS